MFHSKITPTWKANLPMRIFFSNIRLILSTQKAIYDNIMSPVSKKELNYDPKSI